MRRTLFSMTMAAQLAASVALAQSADGSSGSAILSGSFGSDWSTSLGAAMFGDDNTTVRPASEIETQWITLSEEDRAMIRRDCMAFMQEAGDAATGPAVSESNPDAAPGDGPSDAPAPVGTAMVETGTTADTSVTGIIEVPAENMQAICAATADL